MGDFSLPRPIISSTYRSILIFAGYSLLFGAVSRGTDNACHIGGLVTGLVMGSLIAVSAPERERVFMRLTICIAVVAALAGSAFWVERSRSYVVFAQHGSALLEQGKPLEAIAEFQRALERSPHDATIHFQLAHAYMGVARYANAEAELKAVLVLEPADFQTQNDLGMAYVYDKKLAEARKVFTQMLDKFPNSAAPHSGVGSVAMAEENYPLAIQEYQKAAQIEPDAGDYYSLGIAFSKLQRHDEAITALKRSQETYGDDHDTELALADAYRAKGMTKEADEAAAKATQLK
jgi:tetratricopeptide (TPR) repeat protein